MNILKPSLLNFSDVSAIKTNLTGSFSGAARSLSFDVFQKSDKIKHVAIKDMQNNVVPACISEEDVIDGPDYYGENPKKFNISVNGDVLGYAILYNHPDNKSVYLKSLYTEENDSRHYKGAGTELLKAVVKESKKRGFEGRVSVLASNYPPPFVFYYKNNFSVTGRKKQYNAAIDYAARNNIPVSKVLPKTENSLEMELDKKGAKALLNGKRLYEANKPEKLASKIIEGSLYEAFSISSPDSKEKYLFVINNDAEDEKMAYSAKMKMRHDKKFEKFLKIFGIQNLSMMPEVAEFAEEAATLEAKREGVEKIFVKKGLLA